jgi:hypothetical protein
MAVSLVRLFKLGEYKSTLLGSRNHGDLRSTELLSADPGAEVDPWCELWLLCDAGCDLFISTTPYAGTIT